MSVLGVVIPTVPGRAEELARAIESHSRTPWPFGTAVVLEVVEGFKTCGEAWNAGAANLLRDHGEELRYLCFTADDLIAAGGWAESAIATWETERVLPAPILRLADGELDPRTDDGPPGTLVHFSRVPFLPAALWAELEPMPPLHYYSDGWIGDRVAERGYSTAVTAGYEFVHSWAQAGRLDDDGRDRTLYVDDARANPYRHLPSNRLR